MSEEQDADWRGWDDFLELDLTEEREEDWSFEEETWWIVHLRQESAQFDLLICLECGEFCVQCVCRS